MCGGGVPDSNFCADGVEGWLEFKQTKAWAVGVQPAQVGWTERRLRAGGHVMVAVRRLVTSGPRKVAADELWLLPGSQLRTLAQEGLDAAALKPSYVGIGGPSRWNWSAIREFLIDKKEYD